MVQRESGFDERKDRRRVKRTAVAARVPQDRESLPDTAVLCSCSCCCSENMDSLSLSSMLPLLAGLLGRSSPLRRNQVVLPLEVLLWQSLEMIG